MMKQGSVNHYLGVLNKEGIVIDDVILPKMDQRIPWLPRWLHEMASWYRGSHGNLNG